MEKNAYLDAMEISRWQLATSASQQPEFLILHDDDDTPPSAEFIEQILSLMELSDIEYHLTEKPLKGAKVVWDMRSRKTRPHIAWIESQPMKQLLNGSSGKRQLWQQICDHLKDKK
ncbi:hypothetical protein SOPP22_17000 [Shewanella sp. OPT22]|nr:hypothetical protein SOPP22_17000 [Shewanella sp. OPT22]